MNKKHFVFKNAQISYIYNTIHLNKPTIICLHGFLEHKAIFEFLYEDTYFCAYNILSIDLLGHHESDCIGFIHSMEDQAAMVYELIYQLGLKKVNLIGHSLGGYVSLAFLELYPEIVNKVCLLNSTAKADSESKKINRARGIELVKKNAPIFIQMALANLFDEKTRLNHITEIEDLKQIALQNKTQGVIANMQGMMNRKDRTFLLKQYSQKLFYIAGINDLIMSIADVRFETITNNIPLFDMEGYHMLWLENPNEIKKILKDNL